MPGSAALRFAAVCGILLVAGMGCVNSGRETSIPLADRFDDFPLLKQLSRLEFTEADYFTNAGKGWALPGGRPNNPYWIAAAPEAEVRILLDSRGELDMRLLCRAGRETGLSIRLNDREVASESLQPGRNRLRVPLPEEYRLPGPNRLVFRFSPAPENPGQSGRIVFRRLEFLPIPQGEPPRIEVLPTASRIRLQGSLQGHFLFRTGRRPRFSFKHRLAVPARPAGYIILKFDDRAGEVLERRIEISSPDWKEEMIRLKGFERRTVRISYRHEGDPETVSELQDPVLLDRLTEAARSRRILLIGLDGAAWEVMNPLLARGELPHLAGLMREGASAPLRTVRPWYSPVVWTSIATGKTMEKHGITGFLQQRHRSDRMLPNNRLDRKCRAIWNILSSAGRSVGLIGPWVTWPAESVNGFVLSDRMDFKNLEATTYPSELKGFYFRSLRPDAEREPLPAYSALEAVLHPDIPIRSPVAANLKEARLYYRQDLWKSRAGLALDRVFHADFTFLYLRGPDVTSHFFWKYYRPDADVPEAETRRFGDLLPLNYRFQDAVIGEYLQRFGPDATVIIVSDHGMGRKSYLPELGFEGLGKLLKDLGIDRQVREALPTAHGVRIRPARISQAAAIRARLLDLRAGRDRKPVFAADTDMNRDVIELTVAPGFAADDQMPLFDGSRRLGPLGAYSSSREISGDHTLDGILLMRGPDIRSGVRLERASVLDIAPTLLHLMDLPAGRDMDGRVLLSAFSEAYRKSHPVRLVDSHDTERAESRDDQELTSGGEQDEELIRRLKSLGYIK